VATTDQGPALHSGFAGAQPSRTAAKFPRNVTNPHVTRYFTQIKYDKIGRDKYLLRNPVNKLFCYFFTPSFTLTLVKNAIQAGTPSRYNHLNFGLFNFGFFSRDNYFHRRCHRILSRPPTTRSPSVLIQVLSA
jgi:hypothetical protein